MQRQTLEMVMRILGADASVSDDLKSAVKLLMEREANESEPSPLLVGAADAQRILGCKETKFYELVSQLPELKPIRLTSDSDPKWDVRELERLIARRRRESLGRTL